MEIQSVGRGCGKGVCGKEVVTRTYPLWVTFKAHPLIFTGNAQESKWYKPITMVGDFQPWKRSPELFASWYGSPSLPDPRLQARSWSSKNWSLSSPPRVVLGKILILTDSKSRVCQSLAENKLFREDLIQGQILWQKEQIQKISMMFKT